MASKILLAIKKTIKMDADYWKWEPESYKSSVCHARAIIAKGNIIEGIEAKA